MDEKLLPEIIEKRELNFSYKEKQRKRIEELLGHDDKLINIFYKTTFAKQQQEELCNKLDSYDGELGNLFFRLGCQGLVDNANCDISFSKNGEPVKVDSDNIQEYAVEIANYLEVFAKALVDRAAKIRQQVSEIPQISYSKKDMNKIRRAEKQAEDELWIPYVKKLEEIHKRLLEKQQKLS